MHVKEYNENDDLNLADKIYYKPVLLYYVASLHNIVKVSSGRAALSRGHSPHYYYLDSISPTVDLVFVSGLCQW